ncbi:ABC transporter transmembrane domain-containing protein, partial [Pedobacter sp.]|uniref:ABC transporter transmembrane domain-containing protein n=1 Tax=Pedobacter sp. TaxID=1411316 RepID=UPI003D7F2458
MNYNLNQVTEQQGKKSTLAALKKLLDLISMERNNLLKAMVAILINSGLLLLGPFLIGYAIDHYIRTGQYRGLLIFTGILLVMYLITLITGYLQTKLMGGVGQRMLYTLRNAIFNKLLTLPVGFFNQNKSGDLISR